MTDLNDEATADLSPEEMAALAALGTRRAIEVGEYLYEAGDVTYDFFVMVSGSVDIVVGEQRDRVIVHHGPGRFLGELNLLTGLRVLVSCRVVEAGEVVVVPRDSLLRVIATMPELSDKILKAFMARRAMLISGDAKSGVRVISSRYSPESVQVLEFLSRSHVPHEWHDADDPEMDTVLRELAVEPADLPVVVTAQKVLRRPTPGEVAEYLGLTLQNVPERCFDLVIVGAGPAGLASAVYGASEGLSTLVVDMFSVGGQAGGSSRIENYLGFPTGISGGDLTGRALVQAEKFGARFSSPCTAMSMREEGGHLIVRLSDGTDVAGRAVIAASGASYRRLDVERLSEFEGNGVYYAATELEARMCQPSPVVVVGGGNSAGQAAIFLAESGSPVNIVIRREDLGITMSRYLVDRIEADPRITVRTKSQVSGLDGVGKLGAVRITGPEGELEVDCAALFSFIGAEPSSGWISRCAAVDEHGFMLTDRQLDASQLGERWEALGRLPLPYETSRPGLFAVGDLRSGSTKRVAAAVGEGSACVGSVHQYLAFAH